MTQNIAKLVNQEGVGGLKYSSQKGFQTNAARINLFNFLFRAERSGKGRGVGASRLGWEGESLTTLILIVQVITE